MATRFQVNRFESIGVKQQGDFNAPTEEDRKWVSSDGERKRDAGESVR